MQGSRSFGPGLVTTRLRDLVMGLIGGVASRGSQPATPQLTSASAAPSTSLPPASSWLRVSPPSTETASDRSPGHPPTGRRNRSPAGHLRCPGLRPAHHLGRRRAAVGRQNQPWRRRRGGGSRPVASAAALTVSARAALTDVVVRHVDHSSLVGLVAGPSGPVHFWIGDTNAGADTPDAAGGCSGARRDAVARRRRFAACQRRALRHIGSRQSSRLCGLQATGHRSFTGRSGGSGIPA